MTSASQRPANACQVCGCRGVDVALYYSIMLWYLQPLCPLILAASMQPAAPSPVMWDFHKACEESNKPKGNVLATLQITVMQRQGALDLGSDFSIFTVNEHIDGPERTGGVVRHAAEGGGAAREALALPPHRHDELLQRDAIQALGQVGVPGHNTHTMGYHQKQAPAELERPGSG